LTDVVGRQSASDGGDRLLLLLLRNPVVLSLFVDDLAERPGLQMENGFELKAVVYLGGPLAACWPDSAFGGAHRQKCLGTLERAKGIEPSYAAWESLSAFEAPATPASAHS